MGASQVIQGAQIQEEISRLSGAVEDIRIQEGMFVSLTKGSKNWCMLAIPKLFLDTKRLYDIQSFNFFLNMLLLEP